MLERYQKGGYHPVQIGDRFNDRYDVFQKLGHGSYSTVWLARDKLAERVVALKVCTADSDLHELGILSELSGSLAGKWIPSTLDSFNVRGPNGVHSCQVTQPAMMSLSEAKDASYNRLFKLDVARALAAQAVLAVDSLHLHGVAHGDLSYGNILVRIPPDYKYGSLEPPERVPITRFDRGELSACIPSHATLPCWLGEGSDDLDLSQSSILISDFGEAFYPARQDRFHSNSPLIYRASEARFQSTPLSYRSDIWSLACLIWDIIAQNPLFEGFLAKQDDITCEHVDALGTLPQEWSQAWNRHKYFDENGKPRAGRTRRSWEDRFEDSIQEPRKAEGMPELESEEKDALSVMLKPMLAFLPESRSSAKDVLHSEWMVKWALPEYHKISGWPTGS